MIRPATALALAPTPAKALRDDADTLQRAIDRILLRLRLAVIHGGDKAAEGAVLRIAPNRRPWKSYAAVAHDIARAMVRLGCRQEICVIADDRRLPAALEAAESHLAWINSAGVQGRAAISHTPAMLEMLGVPYIGHDPLNAATLDDKHAFKRRLVAAGLPTAPSFLVPLSPEPFRPTECDAFRRAFGGHRGPFVVKPVSGRASLMVSRIDTILELREAVAEIHRATHAPALIERFLGGAEYCVAVGGPVVSVGGRLTRLGGPFVFSALERVLEPGEAIFTSMDVRPISDDRARPLDPVADAQVLAGLTALARGVHSEFGLSTLVRLDVRADERGDLYILEANPKPDLKAPAPGCTSLVSIGLAERGMSYDDLILSTFASTVADLIHERHPTMLGLAGL